MHETVKVNKKRLQRQIANLNEQSHSSKESSHVIENLIKELMHVDTNAQLQTAAAIAASDPKNGKKQIESTAKQRTLQKTLL
jgi:hypothetical protein